jgi:hypothetical protein
MSTDLESTFTLTYQTFNLTLSINSYQSLNYAFALKDIVLANSHIMYFDILVLKTSTSNLIISFLY